MKKNMLPGGHSLDRQNGNTANSPTGYGKEKVIDRGSTPIHPTAVSME